MTDTKIDIGFLLAHGLSRAAAESLMQEIARVLAVGFVPREELERVNRFRENTGRKLHVKSDALQEALAHLVATREELERVRKEAAAATECLRVIEHACVIREASGIVETRLVLEEIRAYRHNLEVSQHGKTPTPKEPNDTNPNHLCREQVKPLVDALRSIEFDQGVTDSTGRKPVHVWLSEEKCNAIRDAIDHARKLGFPTTQATPISGGALTGGQLVEGAETAKE